MDIPELLTELNIDYREHGTHHHTSVGWVQIDCPYCSPNTGSFRLGINLQWGNANCWTCGKHKLGACLAELSNKTKDKTYALLKSVSFDGRLEEKSSPRGKLELPTGLGPLLPIHKAYLKERKFNPDELSKLWNLQGIALHAKLAWRLFIPIHYKDKVVSWTTRSLVDTGRRYLNAKPEQEIYPIRSLLYGEDYCQHAIIVCEGPMDVFRIGPGAVATLGVDYTNEQLNKIAKYPVRVICFDGEVPAQQQAHKLLADLSVLPGITHNVVLDSKDPGEASRREIKRIRKFLS